MFSDHKNLVYAAKVSESQRVMRWRLILEEFGPNIQHIAGIDNVVADMLSHVPSANSERVEPPEPSDAQSHANALFALEVEEAIDNGFPLTLIRVFNEQQNELSKRNSKIKALLDKKESGYVVSNFEGHALIMHEKKMYVPESLCGRTLEFHSDSHQR